MPPGITSVSCNHRSSNTTSTVLPANFSYFHQPGDPWVGRNRSNPSSRLKVLCIHRHLINVCRRRFSLILSEGNRKKVYNLASNP